MPAAESKLMARSALVFLLLGIGVAFGLALALLAYQPHPQPAIEWLDSPREIVSFHLESEEGVFNQESLKGQWTIVLFGFLNCPDICPTSLSELAKISTRLRSSSANKKVNYVFVSVDPGRDSVSGMTQYLQFFDSSIQGVTGSEEQLNRFANSLGTRFKVSPYDENYTVAHSVTFSIIDPSGALSGRFRPGIELNHFVRGFVSR